MHFDRIKEIDLKNSANWNETAFLTFDIDWASDEILNDTLDIVEEYDVCATFFVTHNTPVLNRIRQNCKFELGIHPNFNFLLSGTSENESNYLEVINNLMEIVPEAKSVRSHSLTQNSRLLDIFQKAGLTHESNHFIPYHSNIELRPWYHWNGLIRVPFGWVDDVHCLLGNEGNKYQQSQFDIGMQTKGLKVFDFHPIHVFLNTESLDRYENTRHVHQKPAELISHRYEGYGIRSILIELLESEKMH